MANADIRKNVTVTMPLSLHNKLKAVSRKTRIPFSWVVCDLIEKHLKGWQPTSTQ